MASDIIEIEKTIQTYMDGLYEGDIPKLETIFDPSCVWFTRDGDTVSALPVSEWFNRIGARESAKSQGLERGDELSTIEIAGPELAFARLNVQIPPRYFTDYMTLLKLPTEGWKIVSKTFYAESRE